MPSKANLVYVWTISMCKTGIGKCTFVGININEGTPNSSSKKLNDMFDLVFLAK